MVDQETKAFLESGCALIIGTVGPDGEPHAGRGWGLDLGEAEPVQVARLVLDAADLSTVAHLRDGGAVALTATSVRTLSSIQLKGRSLGLDDLRPQDLERAERYISDFFRDIIDVDGTDPALLATYPPTRFTACRLELHERFDQTPGPGAGARIQTAR